MDIQHDATNGRFSAVLEGHGLEVDYQRTADRLIFTHTGTAPALRGRGLAGQMVEHALRWAAPLGLQLVPACGYVAAHIARHRHWARLLEPARVQQVLNFWFGALGSELDGQVRGEWFRKDEAFDAAIRATFGPLIGEALAGRLDTWQATPLGRLALIVLLDQMTRNSFRGTAKSFAGDPQALATALALLDDGTTATTLTPLQRWFALMPLEHAEDLALQQRSVREFTALAAQDPRLAGAADYAQRHLEVIVRFGRFPHRNVILGRESSPAELEYLAQPGAGF